MSMQSELRVQEILQGELKTAHRKVYKQQPGSLVFFSTTKTDALAACKEKQDKLILDIKTASSKKEHALK